MATSGVHVLVYTYPALGHLIPLLDLTHRLVTRGLTVTVLVTPNHLSLLDPLKSCHASSSSSSVLHALVFPLPEPDFAFSKNGVVAEIKALREAHYPLIVEWFKAHASPPVAIISDFFHGWTQELADNLGVPRVTFSPSGALALSVQHHLQRDLPQNSGDGNENYAVSFGEIPNSPTYPWYQLPDSYRKLKRGDPDWDFYRTSMLANMSAWGIVFNSFAELERV